MNLIEWIKLKLGVPIKALDEPIENWSLQRKDMVLRYELQKYKKSEEISKRFFDVFDSLDSKEKDIVLTSLYTFEFSREKLAALNQEIYEGHVSHSQLLEMLFNKARTTIDKIALFESSFDKLNDGEIKAFLDTASTWFMGYDDYKEALILALEKGAEIPDEKIVSSLGDRPELVLKYAKKIDTDYLIRNLNWEKIDIDVVLDKLKTLDLENQIQFWQMLRYHDEENKYIYEYDKWIEGLSVSEQFFANYETNKQIEYDSPKNSLMILDLEELKTVIINHPQLLDEIDFTKFYFIDNYSIEDMQELLRNMTSLTSDAKILDISKKLEEIIKDKVFDMQYKEYCSLTNLESKTEIFKKMDPSKFVENYLIYARDFKDEISKIPKEKLIERFAHIEGAHRILRTQLDSKEMYQLLMSEKINFFEIKKEDLLVFSKEEIDAMLKKIFQHSEEKFKYTFLDIIQGYRANSRTNNFDEGFFFEEDLITFSESKMKELKEVILGNFLLLSEKNKKIYYMYVEEFLSPEQIRETLKSQPEIKKYIRWDAYKFNLEDLLDLQDIGENSIEFKRALYEKLDYEEKLGMIARQESLGDELTKIKIECLKSILDDKEYLMNNTLPQMSEEEIEQVFSGIKDKSNKILFLSKVVCNLSRFDNIKDFLADIDDNSTGNYLKLFNSIDSNDNIALLKFFVNLDIIDRNQETLLSLLEKNPNLCATIDYKLLDFLEGSQLEFLARYETNTDVFRGFSDEQLELLRKMRERIYDNMDYSDDIFFSCIEGVKEINKENVKALLESNEDLDKIIFLCNKRKHLIGTLDSIQGFEQDEEKYYKKILENPNSTDRDILDVYMRKFFNMRYDEAEELVQKYESGLPKLLVRYNSKSELAPDEARELSAINQVRYMKELMQISDVEALRETYYELQDNPNMTKPNYMENFLIEENMRRAYTKEKRESLYVPQSAEKTSEVKYNGNSIDIYKPQDNWKMMVSVIGAYVKNEKANEDSYREWNSNERVVNHGICTSLVANNNMSMAYRKGSLIFGFCNLDDAAIREEAPYDLASGSNGVKIQTFRSPRFTVADEMISNTRNGHSEVVIERRNKDDDSFVTRRQPDYIIAINEISEASKKAASEFGIPIVYIDTKEVAMKESEKIERAKESFKNHPNLKDLEQIVREYHNNFSGLVTLDKKSCNTYFNPRKNNKDFIELASIIAEMPNTQKKAELIEGYKFLVDEELEKRKNVTEKKYNPIDLKKLREKLEAIPFFSAPKANIMHDINQKHSQSQGITSKNPVRAVSQKTLDDQKKMSTEDIDI